MVEHLVLFKIRSSATAEEKALLLRNLLGLKDRVPGILEATAGPNFSDRARGFTHGFAVRFKDRASLEAYLVHPEHQAVVDKFIKPISEGVLVVDYEPV